MSLRSLACAAVVLRVLERPLPPKINGLVKEKRVCHAKFNNNRRHLRAGGRHVCLKRRVAVTLRLAADPRAVVVGVAGGVEPRVVRREF